MDICEKINYITGKIVAYLLLIVYPFVMHNILIRIINICYSIFIIPDE